MKAIQTIKNIWKIEDLRNKILFTFLLILVYRFGSFIVLPGVNPEGLKPLENQTSEGLMSLLNMFSGGAFSNASIFALGIMPYISASIVVQLLTIALPYFQKIQKDAALLLGHILIGIAEDQGKNGSVHVESHTSGKQFFK